MKLNEAFSFFIPFGVVLGGGVAICEVVGYNMTNREYVLLTALAAFVPVVISFMRFESNH